MSDFFAGIFDDLYDYGADTVDKLWTVGKDLVKESRLDQMLSGDYDFSGKTGSSPLSKAFMESQKIAPRRQFSPDADMEGLFAGPQAFQPGQTRKTSSANPKALESEWLERLGYLFRVLQKTSKFTASERG